ncbi:MAG: hypothetical protein M0R77_14820, partial [Gammaproteobacteria bacterium]|nr:hypothetical protein [Gammaproteobacteria bacterium]
LIEINADPSFYLGKEYIFDGLYTIKLISISRDAYVVSLEVDDVTQISRITFVDFMNHLRKGTMVEKTVLEAQNFNNYDEYYQLASSFLLINYGILIDNIVFDWQSEFLKETPIEIACKIALGIIKK